MMSFEVDVLKKIQTTNLCRVGICICGAVPSVAIGWLLLPLLCKVPWTTSYLGDVVPLSHFLPLQSLAPGYGLPPHHSHSPHHLLIT